MPNLLDPAARLEGVPQPIGAAQVATPVPPESHPVGAGDGHQLCELDADGAALALASFLRERFGRVSRNG